MAVSEPIKVTVVGAGMIVHDLILPSLYHLQRLGLVGGITVVARSNRHLRLLKESKALRNAFPGQDFQPMPGLDAPPDARYPDLYKEAVAAMAPRNLIVIALPDAMHYEAVQVALEHDQHVLCEKPFVLRHAESVELQRAAKEKALFIGVEYHKRFDTRALMARRHYEEGHYGEFVIGEAKMIEPWFYRNSNFQNWFTCDQTDPFVYVGCHYVDLVHFITGLRPVAVSVHGVKRPFPNGNVGYMWANGRVVYENGAILSVTDGLGYPDAGAGSNEQCLTMFCEGDGKTGLIKHNDQFRGVTHCYLEGIGCAGSAFNFVSPDFYQLVPWLGDGWKPVGYGYESVAATVRTVHVLESAAVDAGKDSADERLAEQRGLMERTEEAGLIATPSNSATNDLVMEAARESILRDGDVVEILYDDGEIPRVAPRHA